MEIEKKRETSWKIQLKKTDEYIEITSVEISGEVRQIKLGLINKDKSIRVEMSKEDFFKFLSLISAFKDVVIGEESILVESELNIVEDKPEKIQEYSQIEDDLYQINSKPSEESMENNDTEELNPEEWDPW
ncbi:MAG: hypothetical protein EU529_05925 [Promethearchaeota archaeon]|nr:MAG: hypothetical protein EU529_05925 [Candidatus Lokiarchaeota archaeon]